MTLKLELYVHGNSGLKRPTAKTSECIAWLNFLVNAIGDQQPDSGKVHLSSCFTKLALYKKMCEKFDSDDNVSQSQFYSILENKLSHVSIPKVCDALHFKLLHMCFSFVSLSEMEQKGGKLKYY
jgi:hypothetical protein